MLTNRQKETLHLMTAIELEKRIENDLSSTGPIAQHFELAGESFFDRVGQTLLSLPTAPVPAPPISRVCVLGSSKFISKLPL